VSVEALQVSALMVEWAGALALLLAVSGVGLLGILACRWVR